MPIFDMLTVLGLLTCCLGLVFLVRCCRRRSLIALALSVVFAAAGTVIFTQLRPIDIDPEKVRNTIIALLSGETRKG